MKRALIAVLLAFVGTAHAQTSRTAFGQVIADSTAVGKYTLKFAQDGTPLLLPGAPVASTDGAAGVRVAASGDLRFANGGTGTVTATGRVTNANAAKAIAKALGKATPFIGAGLILKELAEELGWTGVGQDPATGAFTGSKTFASPRYSDSNWCAGPAGISNPPGEALGGSTDETYWLRCIAANSTLNSTYIRGSLVCGNAGALANRSCTYSRTSTGSIQTTTWTYVGTAPVQAPFTITQLEADIAAKSGWPSNSKLGPAVVHASDVNGERLPVEAPTVTGPATVNGPTKTTVTNNPDGTRTETTRTPTVTNTYSGPTITTNQTTNTTTNVYNTSNVIISTTTTTETEAPPAAVPAEKQETCGLPGTPACKIDEQGTPKPETLDGTKSATDALKPLKDFAENPTSNLPTFPTLNWAFQLPSGCTAIAIPAFAPYLQSIDICQFLPMFHEIMSMVWVIGALFGAISMFWRSTFAAH